VSAETTSDARLPFDLSELRTRTVRGVAINSAFLILVSLSGVASAKKDRGLSIADARGLPLGTTVTVQGTVTDSKENPVNGAVVYIKNSKTLQIRSFITKEQGAYYFHSLSPDVDYELHAESNGATSMAARATRPAAAPPITRSLDRFGIWLPPKFATVLRYFTR